MATLTIPLEKLAFIVVKAHALDGQVEPVLPDDASNPADDGERQALEDRDDTAYQELYDALSGLNSDELDELVALSLIGRGDFDPSEWEDALALAREASERRLPRRLAADPLLGGYLEEALDALGYSLEDLEGEHM